MSDDPKDTMHWTAIIHAGLAWCGVRESAGYQMTTRQSAVGCDTCRRDREKQRQHNLRHKQKIKAAREAAEKSRLMPFGS